MKQKIANKKVVLTSMLLLIGSFFLLSMVRTDNLKVESRYYDYQSPKEQAYTVLKNTCNKCHVKQNPFKVFTLRNMDRFAPQIERQVFILQRMPKGDEVKLTVKEKETLQRWINTTK